MDDYLSESEVGEHEPYSVLAGDEIVSSEDENGPIHYYDTSDILEPDNSIQYETGTIAVVKSPQPHFAATDAKLAVERPMSPASSRASRISYNDGEVSFDYDNRAASCAATTLAKGPRVVTRPTEQLVDDTTRPQVRHVGTRSIVSSESHRYGIDERDRFRHNNNRIRIQS